MSVLRLTTVVIPFRMASARFPRKALSKFRGKPLLEHAVDNARALGVARIVVTAPAEDLQAAQRVVPLAEWGLEVVPSSASCASATERLTEISPRLEGSYFLSLPIDEPAIQPEQLRRSLMAPLPDGTGWALTFHCEFRSREDYLSPLSAKVVIDRQGMLLYMSRAIIPATKAGGVVAAMLKKSVGVFLFDRAFLTQLARNASIPTTLDKHEGLEQLRWLELGHRVKSVRVEHIGFGIDVPEQIAMLEERLECL